MEFEDWGPVVARIEHDHRENEVAVAKALSFALMGDEVDWRQHLTNAKRFILRMRRTVPGCALPNGDQ
jgi:hypothetical protein